MRGRKPKPTALKLLTGNPGKRRLPKAEPKPPAGPVERPKFLRGRAASLWNEYAPQVQSMGLLTSVDVPKFAAWCALMAKFEAWTRGVKAMVASEMAQMRALGSDFGMDPSSRARLGAAADGKEKRDPAERYFGSA